MTVDLAIPRVLPVAHLSVSSVNAYLKCPEAWRRRYVEGEYEPPSGKMILGSAIGAAESQSDQQQIDTGNRLTTADVLDAFADEWEDRTDREEIHWGDDAPADLKDSGIQAVHAYERDIAPTLRPVSAERAFCVELEGVDWTFQGFIDFEEEDGAVCDRKVTGKKKGQADADSDPQPTSYLFARRAEGHPAGGFRFHTMVRTKTPYAEIVTTARTDAQLDAFTTRLYGIAAEINWRLEHDVWQGAVPGSWWCSQRFCGFWASCPMGGAR